MVRKIKKHRNKKQTAPAKKPSRAYLRSMSHYLLCIIPGFMVIGGLTLLAGPPSKSLVDHDPKLNARYPMIMKQARPSVVLLGNSMLGEAVDERSFMQQTQLRTVKLWKGGWASAAWYLALKNVIVPASNKPDTVVVIFRDHFLTHPTYRVKGQNQKVLDELTVAEEPLLERLAYLNSMGPMAYWLNQNWSLFREREDFQHNLETGIKSFVGSMYGKESAESVNQSIEDIFAVENMLADQLGKAQLKSETPLSSKWYDFEKMLPVSFLPWMVQAARDNDIRLVLVRVKRKREAEGLPTPAGLDSYIYDLKQWCITEEVPFIDFSDDDRFVLEHYADGDHLNRTSGRTLFTRLLVEQLKPYLGSTRAADK